MLTGPTSIAWAQRIVLRDGTVLLVRSLHPSDEPGLLRFLSGLSPRSVYSRFCCGGANLRSAVRRFTQTRPECVGVVTCDLLGEIVGHAEYVLTGIPGQAEVAVVIADELYGKGLARQMLQRLVAEAGARGIEEFVASVLPDNSAMLRVFTRAFGAHVAVDDSSLCDVVFSTGTSRPALRAA
jgi:RimJ/RimL family protein N-acetyltransferase